MVNPQIEVAKGTIGTRALNKNYPVTEGLTAGTTKQIPNPSLEPEVDLSEKIKGVNK